MPRVRRINSSTQGDDVLSSASSNDGLTEHIEAITRAYKTLKRDNATLKGEKEELEAEVQNLQASVKQTPSRGGSSAASRVKTLEKELKDAKKDAAKYKGRYEKLRAAELKRERLELSEGFGNGTSTMEDRYFNMKKLLRRFRGLVEEIVLEDPGESGKHADCSVCYEELTPESSPAAFPCEHIFHMECIRQLDRHAKEQLNARLACPSCRQPWRLDDVLDVTRTAGQQWAELTDVATEWANMEAQQDDVEEWTSDKTSELSFIEEDMEEVVDNVAERGSESEGNAPRTPTRSQKRRRLDELAASRSGKKRKR